MVNKNKTKLFCASQKVKNLNSAIEKHKKKCQKNHSETFGT
jgi:hypothetical protein